jgi:hypothetical protein
MAVKTNLMLPVKGISGRVNDKLKDEATALSSAGFVSIGVAVALPVNSIKPTVALFASFKTASR